MLAELAFLTVWWVIAPSVPVDVETLATSTGERFTYQRCDAFEGSSVPWEIANAFGRLALATWGAFLAFETRRVPAGFNESRCVQPACGRERFACTGRVVTPVLTEWWRGRVLDRARARGSGTSYWPSTTPFWWRLSREASSSSCETCVWFGTVAARSEHRSHVVCSTLRYVCPWLCARRADPVRCAVASSVWRS